MQALRNTPSEVFFTLLNKANCSKFQVKITCVKRKLHALCISSIAILEQKILGVEYVRIRLFSDPYFPVYGKIQARENPRILDPHPSQSFLNIYETFFQEKC